MIMTVVHAYTYRQILLSCCPTTYSYVRWYKDGEALEDRSGRFYGYNNDTTREFLHYYSLDENDCRQDSSTPFYKCIFTCDAYSTDEQEKISHNTTVFLFQTPVPASQYPALVKLEAPECVNEGDDLHIHCQVTYDEREPQQHRQVQILIGNNTELKEKPGEISHSYNDIYGHDVSFNVTIWNISKEYLNQSYLCQARVTSQYIDTIYISECLPEITVTTEGRKLEDKLSLKAGITLAVIIVLVTIVIALVVRFNSYANLWYKVFIMQRLKAASDDYKYDAYIIYRSVIHPSVSTAIRLLEDQFNLSLCIADRDFTPGASTPKSISFNLKASDKVIAFLSNDMFEEEQKACDWSDVSLSLSLALNKRTIIFLLEDIDMDRLKNRKNIKAALKILPCVEKTNGNKEALFKSFSKYFKAHQDSKLV
ncbi:interleukin-18 receptor 1-like [Watersipora subatra]|uniref:interleukin-18 receptor 1-like n=1 Tax=Watersipora subatra TaxID=2589382 RepID=UPI00355B2F24